MYVAVVNLRVGRLNIRAGQRLDGLPPDMIKMLVREGSARIEESVGAENAPALSAPVGKHAKKTGRSQIAKLDDEKNERQSTADDGGCFKGADDDMEQLPEPSESERRDIISSVLSAAYDGV